jgi:RecJ-like exonuclease
MNMEGVTMEIVELKGPMSFRYTTAAVTIPDGCPLCDGEGLTKHVTDEDRKDWDNREPCDCGPDDCCECDEYGPFATGIKDCSRCNGIGRIAGAGPLLIHSQKWYWKIITERAERQAVMEIYDKFKQMDKDMMERMKRVWE